MSGGVKADISDISSHSMVTLRLRRVFLFALIKLNRFGNCLSLIDDHRERCRETRGNHSARLRIHQARQLALMVRGAGKKVRK